MIFTILFRNNSPTLNHIKIFLVQKSRSGLIMSCQDSNQLEARITAQLECPVCYNIPRELPLPCCMSGHIVCRSCKTRVTDCPTCRQPMPPNMTNSLVGALIEQVQHKCKYNDQGCDVKMMLNDLQAHERVCPERTINCAYNNCGSIVKLKDFNEHAFNSSHSIHVTANRMCLIIARDGINLIGPWKMTCMQAHDVLFHVRFAYFRPQNCYALSVWSASAETAKYRANFKIFKRDGDDMEMSMSGLLITSVEGVPSIDKCMDENGKYFWCIPLTLVKHFAFDWQSFQMVKLDVKLKKL